MAPYCRLVDYDRRRWKKKKKFFMPRSQKKRKLFFGKESEFQDTKGRQQQQKKGVRKGRIKKETDQYSRTRLIGTRVGRKTSDSWKKSLQETESRTRKFWDHLPTCPWLAGFDCTTWYTFFAICDERMRERERERENERSCMHEERKISMEVIGVCIISLLLGTQERGAFFFQHRFPKIQCCLSFIWKSSLLPLPFLPC